jgi:hypothetical protein
VTRVRTFLFAAVVSVAAVAASTAAAGAAPVDPAAAACTGAPVDTTIDGFVTDLEQLRHDLDRATAAQAAGLAGRLPACWRVRADRQTMIAESDWLRRALGLPSATAAQWNDRRTALIRRLDAVIADAREWGVASAATSPRLARAQLQSVLTQPEFTRANHVSWTSSLASRLRQWIDDRLRALTGRRLPLVWAGTLLAWTVGIGVLVLLCVWLWRLRRGAALPLDLRLDAPRLTSSEWAALARTALARGDAREAVRCGYHAALYRLEEQGLWRVDPARTPREYLRLLPAADARRTIVDEMTRDFERAWYAHDTPDASRLLAHLEGIGCHARPDAAI